MAKCSHCQAETELYVSGVPTCLKCAEEIQAERDKNQGRQPPQPDNLPEEPA